MEEEKSDNEIIELYKNGEKEALRHLINRYASPIFNFVARLTNRSDAPDIAQVIFIKAWKNIRKFDPQKASFKTWIFIIARNSVTDFWRKKKNILFTEIEESFSENIPDENLLPDEVLQKLEDTEILNQTLEKLRPDYREVLVLYYQEEMTFEEIGEVLNKSINTVKSWHRRAILELRKIME